MASPQPRIGVVTYPGSQDDRDALWALAAVDAEAVPVWHDEESLPAGTAGVVLPGGFSFGDYLRCGAIARFSPVMRAVAGERRDRVHQRRETRDRSAAKVVAVREPAGEDDACRSARQLGLRVPHARRARIQQFERMACVAIVVRAGEHRHRDQRTVAHACNSIS